MTIHSTSGSAFAQAGHVAAVARPIDIVALCGKLLRRWYFVFILMVAGVALGYKVSNLIPPRYTALASILIDPKRPGSFGADSEFASLYVDSAKVASVLTILQSADLLGRVVDSQQLASDPEFASTRHSVLHAWLTAFRILPTDDADSPDTDELRRIRAVARLSRAVHVERVGITYVVDVRVTASTPEKAQRLTQALADCYLDDQIQSKATATQRDYAWLTTRLGEARERLLHSEEAVAAVREKYGLTDTGSATGATVDQQAIAELNTQLLQADADVAARQARYAMAERMRKTGLDLGGLPEAAESRVVQDLRKQQNDIRRRLDDLKRHYTSAYPELSRAQHDLETVNGEIDVEMSRIVAGLRHNYDSAMAKQQTIKAELARRTQDLDSGSKADGRLQLRAAQRAVDSDRSLYNTFLGKLQELEQQLARHDPEARIISPADLPDGPSFPKPLMLLGGGAVLGAVAGAGLALTLPARRRGFANVRGTDLELGIPVHGVLPLLPTASRGGPLNVIDYLAARPFSQFAECLRALRLSLRIGAADSPHVVQITSAAPGEGKSTVAAALAVSSALSGVRTALIEADIRRPSIDGMFQIEKLKGLLDVLCDDLPLDVAVQRHRGLPLSILTAGNRACVDPDILSSRRFADLVQEVARDHELVLLDCPPVLAASDPLAIAKVADETVLIVDAQRTPPSKVNQAVAGLHSIKARLHGVVMTKADPSLLYRFSYGYGVYGDYAPPSLKGEARALQAGSARRLSMARGQFDRMRAG